ncbi:MAG: adenosylcobinamide-phosphate synthase CbiB [Deferribacteraceae bacterium]|jgi:adenosylcobinamide-phosphate synthase|nr:adenosylcobinamide-phosphate synthase CbiB [Deferribacteraceae bacterium]
MSFFISAHILSLITGFFLDICIGDPAWRVHPVRLIGKVVSWGERLFYRKNGFFAGAVLFIFTISVVSAPYFFILFFAYNVSALLYIVFSSLGVWTALSIKDMKKQVLPVADALDKKDMPLARQSLSLIVSRDTQLMERPKIVSSAIETVGENFTDAVFSPVIYAFLAGGFGAVFYKAVSTLDSMVGYRNDRYEKFGAVSAKADDIMGFIPARVSIIPIMLGAALAGENPADARKTYIKYRKSHSSPNSAHGIAAFAGALRVTLGGTVSYGGVECFKPEIIGGKEPLSSLKIRRALKIYEDGAFFAILMASGILWLFAHICNQIK